MLNYYYSFRKLFNILIFYKNILLYLHIKLKINMKASEARELTEQCIVNNEEQIYKTVISKIIVKCGEGSNELILPRSELTLKTIKKLTEDGYEVNQFNQKNIALITW